MTPLPSVWCNVDLPSDALDALRAGLGGRELHLGSSAPRGEVGIAFGQPDVEPVLRLAGLKWIQVTSAGYTRYDTAAFRERLAAKGALMTNSSSVFDEPCAQHLLAFMLAFARQLPAAIREQQSGRGWIGDPMRKSSFLLKDQTVLLVGYGAIAKRMVELLAPFGLSVLAFRRTVQGDETVPTYPIGELARFLPEADHVANILPANDSTEGLFGPDLFAQMKSTALFYNIGRGTTVDQAALIAALETGRLAGAYLDVTDPEPLPSDHPLWSVPNCHITPHTAGGHHDEWLRLVRHFLQNLRRFEAGEALSDRVM